MNPFSQLRELAAQLQHPAVRDLAWVLLSQPLLLEADWPQRHPLAASDWAQVPEQLVDWLQGQDQDPSALDAWLARASNRRLGLYYEKLWQFALQAAPGVELLAANVAIRQGGQTLGEMDLLIRDADGDHHIELACKFYLGPQHCSGLDPANWLGPGGQDRLGLKLEHLRHHQLPLSSSPLGGAALTDWHIEAVQAELWLGGYLFYPWPSNCTPPQGAHAAHLRGHWLHRAQWPSFAAQATQARWQVLPRSRWLAPARADEDSSLTLAQLELYLQQSADSRAPLLLVQLEQRASGAWHELQRLFLVNNDWPTPDE
ncbi:MAG: DUF1853 family protein [Pseudomonas sp.]|uniref:DUF1853 family protein n=1 Tax=Pseudomonas sp. TaxID=306 RepID=UPI0027330C73|nr:DUF1853 family protein [Pseudomonas sp.]MDP3844847.1 DUF1853 family protein [Pseudomonas sp.]